MSRAPLTVSIAAQSLIVLIVGLAALHLGGGALKKTILSRPDLQVLQRDPPAQTVAVTATSKIHVIEEHGTATLPSPTRAAASPLPADLQNRLFASTSLGTREGSKPGEPNVEAANAPSDYFALLITGEHLRLDALTHNGAIINGHYIPRGGTIDDYAYPAPGTDADNPAKYLTPRLTVISGDTAIVTEPVPPHRKLKLTLN